jgi:hypothetical protein
LDGNGLHPPPPPHTHTQIRKIRAFYAAAKGTVTRESFTFTLVLYGFFLQ